MINTVLKNRLPLYLKVNVSSQNGAAIIITMFSLLLICSLLLIASVRSVKGYSQLIRNQQSYAKAFNAAESGLQYGIAYLRKNATTIATDFNRSGYIKVDKITDVTDVKNDAETTFSVSYNNPVKNNFDIIEVKSSGKSLTDSSSSTLTMLVAKKSGGIPMPKASFISYGSADLGGNSSIRNRTVNKTIWSGGRVYLSGSASTTGTRGRCSNRRNRNSDVIESDPALSKITKDQFFAKMLGQDRNKFQRSSNIIINNPSGRALTSQLSQSTNKVVWVNQSRGIATLAGKTTIGSKQKPVVLVINGNFKASGNIDIYGILYVSKNWYNRGGGNLKVHGAAIVEGNFSTRGTPTFEYDKSVLANLNLQSEFTQVVGSWSDF